MATSGSVNFATSRDSLIKYALLNVGGIGEGDTPTSTQYTDGAVYLNMIMKSWHNDGMPLWALKEGYILPVSDTNSINLGPSGGHATLTYTHTTLGADEAAAQTSLTVSSITGITNGDYLGIELDDGSVQWTTVNGVPSGTTVVATTALTGAASSGNHVYAYTTKIQRPVKILEATRWDEGTNNDSPVVVRTHNEWFNQSSKESEGEPNTLWYDPQLTQGIAKIWPRFENGNSVIKIWFHRPYEDFDAAGDEPDCPQEFYMALLWQLSWALSPSWSVPLDERRQWLAEAEKLKQEALAFNMEEGSLMISPQGPNG